MARENENKIERRLPLTETQTRVMLTIFIRKLSAFLVARTQLKPEHFNRGEQGYAMVWSAVLDHYQEMGQLPREHELLTELDRRLQEDTDSLDDAEIEAMDRFVQTAYHDVKRQSLNGQLAAKFLRVFLEDRLADRAREIFQLTSRNPSDIFQLTSHLAEEAGLIQAISGSGVEEPFPKGWDQLAAPVEKWDTGTSFFNHFLNGGDSPGEVCGLLGPYKSAKTTTAIQLSVNRAKAKAREWKLGGCRGPLPLVYYFFYEGSIQEIRVRALAYLAGIDRSTLETGEWAALSHNRETLKEYERRKFARQLAAGAAVWPEKATRENERHGIIFPERYRKKWAEQVLNVNWRAIDMTGNDPLNPGRGSGLADEIVAILRQDQQHNKSRGQQTCYGGVYIDFLLALLDSYINAKGLKKDELRHLIGSFPLQMKNRVALAFRCPVWILHQLSGESNSLSPGVIPHITDSAEGKSFAMHLDFCFQLGNKTPEMLCILACGAARRAAPQSEQIIRINGALAVVQDTNGEWMLDPMTKKIVRKSDLRNIEGGTRGRRPGHHLPESGARSLYDSY